MHAVAGRGTACDVIVHHSYIAYSMEPGSKPQFVVSCRFCIKFPLDRNNRVTLNKPKWLDRFNLHAYAFSNNA